jgi:predicted ribosomally synthesized peptide with SipW-like signal peptide
MAQRRSGRWHRLRSRPRPCDPTLRRSELMAHRRLAARRRLRRRTVIPGGVIALLLALIGGSALAWWSATASLPASITTGTWAAASIRLCPGTAKAPHANPAKPECPKLLPIASMDTHGALALDFGDQRPNSSDAYCDVLRITSLASTPMTITFMLTGSAASLVQSVSLKDGSANTLAAKATGSVVVKLLIPQSTTPGKYSGQLIVGIGGSAEKYALSLVINVVGSASLRLSPGMAKAPHANASKPNCSKLLPIAGFDVQGTLSLDFGDQKPKTSASYYDVFRLTSLSRTSLNITFATSGAAAALIQSVSLQDVRANRLAARATCSVAVKLAIPRSAAPGQYAGQLVVGVAGTSEAYTLPIVINVPGKALSPSSAAPIPAPIAPSSPSPTETPTSPPTPSESPSPTPSVTPSDSPTSSPSPSSTPTDSPSPTPTDSPGSPTPSPTDTLTPSPTPFETPSAIAALRFGLLR